MTRTELRLPRSRPEELGIHPQAITALLNEWQERQIEIHNMMIMRNGQVAAEGWWAPYARQLPHMLFSLSKSFTSTAIGMAVAEGLLSIDDSVSSYFPDETPLNPSPNLQAMRIRHLLMMGTGHETDTIVNLITSEDGNWARAFLQLPVEREPGTHFVYNSGATYMLSAILQKVTGQKLLDYLQPRLFEPLGIIGATWGECPRGINVGGWGLALTTEGIAKFGQLYLQKGLWEGKRLISEAWVEEATSKQIENGDGGDNEWAQGYGYQFWQCRYGAYRGDGAFGQFCIVMPEQDMVIAITSSTNDMQGVLDAIWTHILPAAQDLPIPLGANAEQAALLSTQLASLALHPPAFGASSAQEELVSGVSYQLEENPQQWESLTLRFDRGEVVMAFDGAEGPYIVNGGRGTWKEGSSRLLHPEPNARDRQRTMASFTWQEQDTLLVTLRFVEAPFTVTFEIQLGDQELELRYRQNVSFVSADTTIVRGIR
ncbi:serine hydrolase [Paenibacillus sp. CF384]|uniref:serine hydrolase domain-containing protein n=1 Tax=Paenibacillus sp. CF384 TaxID=1884382 RepID=UPI00089AB9F2|nr:serine hydrolase [Paenibacillus sp. CF384]SDW43909.1 CubicO group peptidase, beta-lactamase class C family [Paenibacillus sp. CF384]